MFFYSICELRIVDHISQKFHSICELRIVDGISQQFYAIYRSCNLIVTEMYTTSKMPKLRNGCLMCTNFRMHNPSHVCTRLNETDWKMLIIFQISLCHANLYLYFLENRSLLACSIISWCSLWLLQCSS